MNQNAQAVIAQLDLEIAQRIELKNSILKFFSPGVAEVPIIKNPVEAPAAPAPQPVKRKYTKRQPVAATPKSVAAAAKTTAEPKSLSPEKLIEILGKLKQPFRAADIQAATGIASKAADNCITKYKAKGWFSKVDKGLYQRTEKFGLGKKAAPVAAQPSPAPAAPKAAAHAASPAAGQLSPGTMEHTVYYAAQKSPEVFTAEALAVSTGYSADAVGIALVKLERKGFVTNCGREDGMATYKIA